MKYSLDTNIITYYLKGDKNIQVKVDAEAENDNIIIAPFAYYEIKKWLLAINSTSKLQAFEKLVQKYGVDSINKETFDTALSLYIKLRKEGITIDDGDLLIAVHCIENNHILVSNNTKHFEHISGLQLVNWSERN
jgi:predicted nucleic acid-binding protein